jgi:hypothetical protein
LAFAPDADFTYAMERYSDLHAIPEREMLASLWGRNCPIVATGGFPRFITHYT